jgi:hypothetical protein
MGLRLVPQPRGVPRAACCAHLGKLRPFRGGVLNLALLLPEAVGEEQQLRRQTCRGTERGHRVAGDTYSTRGRHARRAMATWITRLLLLGEHACG